MVKVQQFKYLGLQRRMVLGGGRGYTVVTPEREEEEGAHAEQLPDVFSFLLRVEEKIIVVPCFSSVFKWFTSV